ncbi:hypothetical protein CHU32_21385 [Superficieibacter electus]|uniref:AraC-type arabinose-binding/dimerisation domain-containing protein n=1 Tax=Superficieibacter electus TaxID=2022662 RepID=A0A2P5GJY5_9ENTR|nr:hypothetical protein CHU33_20500 [Superficieibacter electus]POP44507.1 hypothetical protein CHU32_21385 [Superficieibacter electus]
MRGSGGSKIAPGEIIKYEASQATPWSFFWMGFRGSLVKHYLQRCRLSPQEPVFHESQAGIIKICLAKSLKYQSWARIATFC